jgi:hypothetical protein
MKITAPVLQRKCACGKAAGSSEKCAECEKKLQRKATGATQTNDIPPIVHEVLASPGQPLDVQTRAFMEPRFGHDFSKVRVHTDAKAEESARAVRASAYTVGTHVVFSNGQFAPSAPEGLRLIAHELAHVIQQGKSPSQTDTQLSTDAQANEFEAFAEHASDMALRTDSRIPSLPIGTSGPTLQKQSNDRVSGPKSSYAMLSDDELIGRLEKLEKQASSQVISSEYEERILKEQLEIRQILLHRARKKSSESRTNASGLDSAADIVESAQTGEPIEVPVTFHLEIVAESLGALGNAVQSFVNPLPSAGAGLTRFAGPTSAAGFFELSNLNLNTQLMPRLLTNWNDSIGLRWANRLGLPEASSGSAVSQISARNQARALLMQLSRAFQKSGMGGLSAEQTELLKQVVRIHAEEGFTHGSPFVSATELSPKLAANALPKVATTRAYIVRVVVDPKYVVKVNEVLTRMGKAPMAQELEVLLAHDVHDQAVRITSIKANPTGPLGGRWGTALKWGGKAMVWIGAGIAIKNILTASGPHRRQQQGEAFGGFVGGTALGAFGTGFCIGAGIATGGIALALCGLGFGLAGLGAGHLIGGAVGRKIDQDGE